MTTDTDALYLHLQQLRTNAEALLAQAEQPPQKSLAIDELLHELQVYQIELEMQNEQLRATQAALESSLDRYVDLYDFSPIGYLSLATTDGLITDINLTAAQLLGVPRAKLSQRRFAQFVADTDKDRWYRLFLIIKADTIGIKHSFELLLQRGDESLFYAQLDCLLRADAGNPPTVRIAITEITQRKQAETELRIAAIAFESQEGIMITDAKTNILKVNRAFTETTGYTSQELVGQTPTLLHSGYHDADFYDKMWRSIAATGTWQGEILDRRKNGETYPKWLTITAVKDHQNTVTHYVSVHADISDRKKAENEIEYLAFYDPLTDLPNRRLLMDRLQKALASSTRRQLLGALMFIDLDNFKSLNDTVGHYHGDCLLKLLAQRLLTCVREDDTVARLGGDEFVVMLENLSEDIVEAAAQAKNIAEKILTTFEQPYQFSDYQHRNTASIGVMLFCGNHHSADDLLKWADIAMYQAKEAGRNTVRFFDPKMQETIDTRTAMERDLRVALAENQFTLYYQMQVTHCGKTVGAEVLIRWQHPLHGLIAPLDFIPLAEATGLILPIGQWVLETACVQLKKWADDFATCHLQLAVNVSARQFHQPDFVQQVLAVVARTGIDPSNLKIELTESLVLDNVADTVIKMTALKEKGVKFSMDDFGTGYSSLAYLTQLPLDQLKIDQSFIRNIGSKPSDAVIVQAIIDMTETLGLEVIAEGVETQAQRELLEQYGCTLYQGYLFSKPVPLAAFEALLQR